MTWETFYLICFLVGLALSAVSLLGGFGHFGGHFAGHFHAPHLPHGAGGAHLPQAGVGHGPAGGSGGQATASVPWWNSFSIMVFLCWFGAAGYLLTRYGGFVASVVLVIAAICGLAGGWIVFLFLAKFLMPHERELTAEETAVAGVVGYVSAPIRAGGIGEVIYEQMGARRSVPARADLGDQPIAKNEEVFVLRYEKGVAYVRRWEELENRGQNRGQGSL